MKRTMIVFLLATALAAAATVNYSYDEAGRLVKVDYGSGGSISYTYDKAGNLLSRTTLPPPPAATKGDDKKAVQKTAPVRPSKI